MKKIILAVMLMILTLVSACAPGGSSPTDVRLDPAKPVTITVWHYYNGKQQDSFNELVATFNETAGKESGIIVESRGFGNTSDLENSVLDSVNKQVGASELPNIFAAYADTAYTVDRLGYVVDIAPYLTEAEQAAFIPSYLDEGRFSDDGTLKIFPIAKSVEIFMLNKTDWDKFAQATGATAADFATMEGVTATAKRYYEWTDSLTPEPNDGKAFFWRDANANYMFIGAKQLGAEIFQVTDGAVTLNFDKTVMRKLWDNSYVPYVLGHFASTGRFRSDDIKIGNIISFVGSSAGASFFPDKVIVNDNESYPIEMQAFPCPQFADGSAFAVQQGAGMMVTKTSDKEVYACVEFLKWFTQAERNIQFSLASGYLPVTREANDIERIRKDVGEDGSAALPIIAVAVDTVNKNELYTPRAFESGNAARNILEYAIPDLARADRETVVARMEAGDSLTEAAAEFLTDEYFESWYNATYEKLAKLLAD